MDKKTTGLIATIATALLCGCPGLFICLFGAITVAGKGTFNNSSLSPTVGFVLLCLSLIFIAIPIVVGVVTLRKKPEETAAPVAAPVSEPQPPASPVETVVSQPKPPVDDEPLPPAS